MTDPALVVALASAGTLGLAVATGAALKGWHGWLEVRKLQARHGRRTGRGRSDAGGVELSDLRARVRRLEAIANGREPHQGSAI